MRLIKTHIDIGNSSLSLVGGQGTPDETKMADCHSLGHSMTKISGVQAVPISFTRPHSSYIHKIHHSPVGQIQKETIRNFQYLISFGKKKEKIKEPKQEILRSVLQRENEI